MLMASFALAHLLKRNYEAKDGGRRQNRRGDIRVEWKGQKKRDSERQEE